MTREEARESFKLSNEQSKVRLEVEKMRMDSGEIKELEFYIERDDMAIKALEQAPCEDCISREAVLIELNKYLCGVPFDEKGIDEVIKELPPVTPQPKTGYWIDDKCSVCGKGTEDLISSSEWYKNEEPKFCPFCGIKLQEV